MLDPLERWRELGLPDKPDYAGLLTYAGMPYTQDPSGLAGVDVAVVGAPTDDLVSDRPGTRFGPRAIRAASCPPGPHLEAGVDAFAELRVVDFGDAAVVPADPVTTHAQIEKTVGEVVTAGALPVVLGGDHSITEPNVRAVAARHGAVGLVHFDTHTDTGTEVFGVERSHGTPMYRLVRDGHVDSRRYVQIGLRGYWPGEVELAWQREQGITAFFMHDVRELGMREVVERAVAAVGAGPVFLTVDVDVLDPAFAPGTGTPEVGGITPREALAMLRGLAGIDIVGGDVVEVAPQYDTSTVTAQCAAQILFTQLCLVSIRKAGATP
jgi:agmatinase